MTVRATAGPLGIEVDPERGARLVSLQAHGHELLSMQDIAGVADSVAHGCFPMVPWAGRIRDARLDVDGREARLPASPDGHALHGTGRDAAWEQVGELEFRVALAEPWPVPGEARLRYALTDDTVSAELSWTGDGPGASLGFHPWFRRHLGTSGAAEVLLDRVSQVERGRDGLPTGRLVEPQEGPWDDCFRLRADPCVRWPGVLALTLSSSAPWWVVYTEQPHAVCVEPQTAPPDAFAHPVWADQLAARRVRLQMRIVPEQQQHAAGRPADQSSP